ncbi:peptidoglycan-binding protein [Hyphobacterium sp. HN65]|uniref:Peptidoglycan-binding protein n=1 Tax=Hyphobacterium lacteum TaxID=3116575 RepID=A0ABU7LND1_9PROT|nr:peptidoglycan-binding protein [Hyphobacterium sp. HN65]MEE2525407.1 peptidoglycan-binding protein [Hyphobacterium sp. HN65]
MTLGEWLNRVILDDGPDDGDDPRWENHLESYPGFSNRDSEGDALLRGMVERLTQRVESTEQQSSTVLNEVDRSISDLAERVESADQSWRQDQEKTRGVAEAARKAAEALALRVKRIEEAGGTADPQAMQAFENAFGKLAARVFRNENSSQRSAEIMQEALEDFGQATEQVTLSLQQRIDSIEKGQQQLSDDLRKSGDRTQNTGRVLHGLHNAADRLRRRVEETERLTADVASSFEQSVARIDSRLRSLENRPFGTDTASIDRRFNQLSDELARVVADTRAQVAQELETAASEPRVDRLERALKSAEARIAQAETAHSDSLSRIGLEITRLARVMDDRITESEKKAESTRLGEKAEREMEERFAAVREENRKSVEALGESLSARMAATESRTADAIETATQSMAEALGRIESREQAKAREDDLEARLRASEERTAQRIEEAISGISQRLEQVRGEAEESLSPVQRAMNALADRLEAIESRKAEAEAETPAEPAPQRNASPAPALRQSAYEPDFDTPLSPPPDAETPPGYDDDEVDDPFIIAEAPTRHERQAEPEDEFLQDQPAESRPAPAMDELGGQYQPDEDGLADHSDLESELTEIEEEIAARGPTADGGMILQPMEPVDEPLRPQRPSQQQEQPRPSRPRAPLGATADADFLAAARSRTRGDRSANFDPYASEGSSSGGGRTVMIAASILGFVAIAAAAGLLLSDSFSEPPASTAQALSADVLGHDSPASSPVEETSLASSDQSVPAETVEAPAAEPATPEPADTEAPETDTVEARTTPTASETDNQPREADLQSLASNTPPPGEPEVTTIRIPSMREAAAAGDPVARYLLGEERLAEGNTAAAVALIRRAAEQNVPAAQYRYAKMLERGEGVSQDTTAARQWTRRAAEAGHRRAMHNLGVMYATGSGGEENIEEAFRWFEEAALHGLTDSQYNLAVLFQQGRGTEQSAADAYAWFSIAGNGGDSGAAQQASTIAPTLSDEVRAEADRVIMSFSARPVDAEANGQYDRAWGTTITLDREMIAAAQARLNALGYSAGPADGQMGPQTQAAVRAFQEASNLPATGIIDQSLIGRLETARAG